MREDEWLNIITLLHEVGFQIIQQDRAQQLITVRPIQVR
jgi:hypothetical protein